jgi:hypothetical protein
VDLTVGGDGRAGLGDDKGFRLIPIQIPQVGPNTDIHPQGRIVDPLHPQGTEKGKEPFPLGKVGFERRIDNQGKGKPRGKILKKTIKIIQVKPRVMFTYPDTGPAGYTLGMVNRYFDIGKFIRTG